LLFQIIESRAFLVSLVHNSVSYGPRIEKKFGNYYCKYYSVLHRFGWAKFAYGGSILSSSQFLPLPQLPQKMELKSGQSWLENNRLLRPEI
jgi:hypothetical protein